MCRFSKRWIYTTKLTQRRLFQETECRLCSLKKIPRDDSPQPPPVCLVLISHPSDTREQQAEWKGLRWSRVSEVTVCNFWSCCFWTCGEGENHTGNTRWCKRTHHMIGRRQRETERGPEKQTRNHKSVLPTRLYHLSVQNSLKQCAGPGTQL